MLSLYLYLEERKHIINKVLFGIFYFIYAYSFTKILQYMQIISRDLYYFTGLFALLGLSKGAAALLWNSLTALVWLFPLIFLIFKGTRNRAVACAALLAFVMVGTFVCAGQWADGRFSKFTPEKWECYPLARPLMLKDLKHEVKGNLKWIEVVDILGISDYKVDDTTCVCMVYNLEGYYEDIKLEVSFNKKTRVCENMWWDISA